LFFNCFTVDEFRTSQICPTCNERLLDVRKHLPESEDKRRTKMIRGLKYCSSDTCRSHRYRIGMMLGATTYTESRGLNFLRSWNGDSQAGKTPHLFMSSGPCFRHSNNGGDIFVN
jgi:hypothetical protein